MDTVRILTTCFEDFDMSNHFKEEIRLTRKSFPDKVDEIFSQFGLDANINSDDEWVAKLNSLICDPNMWTFSYEDNDMLCDFPEEDDLDFGRIISDINEGERYLLFEHNMPELSDNFHLDVVLNKDSLPVAFCVNTD